MRKFGTAAIVLLLAPLAPAQAQGSDALSRALSRAMTECAVNPRDAERLACYDAAIAETSAEARAISQRRAEASAKIAAEEAKIAAAAAAQAAKDNFGDESVRSRGNARFASPIGEVDKIGSTLAEILSNRTGFSVYLLENGQLWREVDKAASINTRVGDPVFIERSALGGYKLHFVRQKRVILVKRIK